MKKSILNIGKALDRKAQQNINGGGFGSTCSGFAQYPVSSCNQCVNTIIPNGPTFCFRNCCVQAY
ncbi:hypothetical protein [uncultured Tenacibaculum sp.]|uniref:hypothetical protein n=1 Tax=uncultured Tenacibaculum sp. TaxID=174713 RepID=UPI002608CCAA|nr:hypothetical protein [uncultured Tenacibaculum sp.]